MNDNFCTDCRELLNGLADDKGQAVRVDEKFPHCECEKYSVGEGSPGRVLPDEVVYRLVISPGDIDPEGNVISTAFRNAYEDGLSVFREQATDDDIQALIAERLTRRSEQPLRTVQALLKVKVAKLHSLEQDTFGRLFCVYDETVPRRDTSQKPVPTHATVLQRLPPPKQAQRKEHRNRTQSALYKALCEERVELETFRDGLILRLNQYAADGAFELRT